VLYLVKIKSFSTNNGDMFYIKHSSDNFTIIDCCIDDENKESIINELINESKYKDIKRFISTHPDEDHIRGIEYLFNKIEIPNFYCVKNDIIKDVISDDFKKYCELRDSDKVFNIFKGCKRKWMNQYDEIRKSSGINVLWPDELNADFLLAMENAKDGKEDNNISPILTYSLENNITVYWFGDLETDYLNSIKDNVEWIKADVIIAPHHGRSSGRIPNDILEKIEPKIIIIGEAPSENLDYYTGYETITQNTAEDIMIICENDTADFFVSGINYKTPPTNLKMIYGKVLEGYIYIGSFEYGK